MPIRKMWRVGSKLIVDMFEPEAGKREQIPVILLDKSVLREFEVLGPNNKKRTVPASVCRTAYGMDWERALNNWKKGHKVSPAFQRRYVDEKGGKRLSDQRGKGQA